MKMFEKIMTALAYIVGVPLFLTMVAGLVFVVWDQLVDKQNYLGGGFCLVVFVVGGYGIWHSVFKEEKPYRDYIPPSNRKRRR